MRKTYLRRMIVLLAVFFITALSNKAEAAYQQAVGSSESPVSAAYIQPGKWNEFARGDYTPNEYFYYTAIKKPGTYYWAHVNVQFPKAENKNPRFRDAVPIEIGVYNPSKTANGDDGYERRSFATTTVSANVSYNYETDKYYNYGSSWVRIAPSEKVIVKVSHENAGDGEVYYRFSLDLVEDGLPETPSDINNSHVYRRGDVVKDFIAHRSAPGNRAGDGDFLQFDTDANTLYRVVMKCETLNPDQGTPDVYMQLYYQGSACSFGLTPEVFGSQYFLQYSSGEKDSRKNAYFYIQLKPNTSYQWGIFGTNCKYEISFEKVALSDLNYDIVTVLDSNGSNSEVYVYKGKPIKPGVRLSANEPISLDDSHGIREVTASCRVNVVEKTDYKIDSYLSNDTPGTGYIVLKGVGNVTGTKKIPFTIISDPSAPKKGTSLKYTKGNAKYKVTAAGYAVAYSGPIKKKTSVEIPATVKINNITYRVTSIGANAFKNNTVLKKVTIGKNITSIGKNAFSGCRNLSTLTLGSQVRTIGAQAFMNCIALKKLTLPASVTSIGTKAFYGDKKLSSIVIKSDKLTTKSVGKYAFKGTYAKCTVKVPAKVKSAYKKWLTGKGISKKAKIK